jgi:hypothetical protein
MGHPFAAAVRLAKRGGPGLCCDADGVALGPVPRVEKTKDQGRPRYRPRAAAEILHALGVAYGPLTPEAASRCASALGLATRALERGDLARASAAALHMLLPPLSSEALAKLGDYTSLLKSYDPDQARDERGRWAGGGAAESAAPASEPTRVAAGNTGAMSDVAGGADGDAGPKGGSSRSMPSVQPALAPGSGIANACAAAFNQCLATGERLHDLGYEDESHQLYLGCRQTAAMCYRNEETVQSSPFHDKIETYFPPNKAQNGGGYVSHQKGFSPVYIPPSIDPLAGLSRKNQR